jgi:hypothetical protein
MEGRPLQPLATGGAVGTASAPSTSTVSVGGATSRASSEAGDAG